MESVKCNVDNNEGQRQDAQQLPESAGHNNHQNEESSQDKYRGKRRLRPRAFRLRGRTGHQVKTKTTRAHQQERDRVVKVLPLRRIFPPRASPLGVEASADESPESGTAEGREAADAPEGLCIRLPFSERHIPVYRRQPLTLSKAMAAAGPRISSVLVPLLQSVFSCCNGALAASICCERQVGHCYICGHLLQELAMRVQQKTGLRHDPFRTERGCEAAYLSAFAVEEPSDADTGKSPGKEPLVQDSFGSKESFFNSESFSRAKATLQQELEVASLLDRYSQLLHAERLSAVPQKGCITAASTPRNAYGDKSSSLPLLLLTTPLVSCLPIPPWHLWWPADFREPEEQRAFRVSVQLLHVAVAECHLFREEDALAQKLLSAFEVYAYIARCANGEQLTAKLRSCLEFSKEVRSKCGLPQELQPLLQVAASVVSVYLQEQQPEMQKALLRREIQQLPQIPNQVRQLASLFLVLKTTYLPVRPPIHAEGGGCGFPYRRIQHL